jgi:cytochrome c
LTHPRHIYIPISHHSSRSLKKINSLLDLIDSFPRQNQLDDDVIALLDRIRGKFKTVASALQTGERYADAPKNKMFY